MIGGNLAFGIGWWGVNQSGSSSGKSCGKFLRKNLAGQGGGEKANLRKAVIGGNLTFGIGWWGANQSGSSLGKSCVTFNERFVQCFAFCTQVLWTYLPVTGWLNQAVTPH